jgi:hypothetical protein
MLGQIGTRMPRDLAAQVGPGDVEITLVAIAGACPARLHRRVGECHA